jgi:hypothetical protein
LPLPWWGPVLAPTLIACLLIAGGTLVALYDSPERPLWPSPFAGLIAVAGAALALYVFMADALRALPNGVDSLMQLRPDRFGWPLFLLAWALLAAPVIELFWRVRTRDDTG